MDSSSADTLIERCRRGDGDAFRRLVETHQGYAYALAFRLLCDGEAARDVVQESFIRVWKHLSEYRPTIKFTTWMYRIVVNLSYDRLKTDRRRNRLMTTDGEWGSPMDIADPASMEQQIADRDLAGKIRRLAGTLPEMQRLVFTLRDLQDLSVRETAEILAISVASVKSNLSHARQAIRKRLEPLEKTGEYR